MLARLCICGCGRVDSAGRYGVNSNLKRPKLEGQDSRPLDNTCIRGGVVSPLAPGVKEPGVRSDVDDATALVRYHDASCLLSVKKSTSEIGCEHYIPFRIGD